LKATLKSSKRIAWNQALWHHHSLFSLYRVNTKTVGFQKWQRNQTIKKMEEMIIGWTESPRNWTIKKKEEISIGWTESPS
jgi:hypothetical protein